MILSKLLPFLAMSLVHFAMGLAPLEHADGGGLYFGPWYDRLNGDTPEKTNSRFDYKPFSMFQSDINITDVLQADYLEDIFKKVIELRTDAIVYLTVYPFFGFEQVSDAAILDLATRVGTFTKAGTKVFIRYASEMNGAWFAYGQTPSLFIASWRKVVGKVREIAGTENIAFVWAPNSGNGYPFPGQKYSVLPKGQKWEAALDTNGNGEFDMQDDPYSPYYPGDEWVDWVGMSAYHYGARWMAAEGNNPSGWITNDVPDDNKVESILTGQNNWGFFNFYQMFCTNTTSKPLMITETAATVHMALKQSGGNAPWVAPAGSDAVSRVAIKRKWWQELLNKNTIAKYPKIKAVSTFEFIKFEEESWRDFTSLGKYSELASPLANDGGHQDGPTLEAFRKDIMEGLGDMIIWANKTLDQETKKVDQPEPTNFALGIGSGVSVLLSLSFLVFSI